METSDGRGASVQRVGGCRPSLSHSLLASMEQKDLARSSSIVKNQGSRTVGGSRERKATGVGRSNRG